MGRIKLKAAPLRLRGLIPQQKHKGICTACSAQTEVVNVETNWGVILLCNDCLVTAYNHSKGPQPKENTQSKWVSTDMLDHRLAGSPGSGKKR
jgi:hypothetical protein